MVLLHQADVLYMQNWEHLDFVMRHTNKLHYSNHDTDFSRVRPYFLEGNGAIHRQLLMTTSFVEPEIQAFFREYGRSQAGSVRIKRSWAEGSIADVLHPVKQVFQFVPGVTSFATHEDTRFVYFRDTVLAQVLRMEQKHTLIVTPSYLNYVRLRNELMHQQANAVYVCEYSRDSEISRGRSRFFHGTKDILLYSGRAHFFRSAVLSLSIPLSLVCYIFAHSSQAVPDQGRPSPHLLLAARVRALLLGDGQPSRHWRGGLCCRWGRRGRGRRGRVVSGAVHAVRADGPGARGGQEAVRPHDDLEESHVYVLLKCRHPFHNITKA